MSKMINLIGKRFGRLIVLRFDKERSRLTGRTYWICKCDCGKEISILGYNLTSGRTLSCGCLQRERTSQAVFKDLTGMRFGRLIVLYMDKERSHNGKIYWICKCDCGNIVSVSRAELMNGDTKSCGCLQKERTSEHMSLYNKLYKTKSNRIEFDADRGCLRVYFNNCDDYFLCDIEDRDIVEKYCWHKNKKGYVIARVKGTNKNIRLQRAIMEKYYNIDGLVIDHINHNKLDNRKCNLRICTQAENDLNRNIISKYTKEEYIKYDERYNKYVVTTIVSQPILFDSLELAISFRDEYIKNHPSDFYYDKNNDYNNRNNTNIIYPFRFIDKNEIIQPFNFINSKI